MADVEPAGGANPDAGLVRSFLRRGEVTNAAVSPRVADVVDDHLLGKDGGRVRRAGKRAANCDVKQDEEGGIEDPLHSRGQVRSRDRLIRRAVDGERNRARRGIVVG